ncbi:MAG: hypothetical protein D6E12_18740 [Desulfovibrio sp.]|nr:MAG: hypothetical protein D6E12_18740 [Desulfovibrio sp.]
MLISEKEARFKYCPLLTTHDDKLKFCLGAGCMMWRWKNPERREEADSGYCGQSGRPAGAL